MTPPSDQNQLQTGPGLDQDLGLRKLGQPISSPLDFNRRICAVTMVGFAPKSLVQPILKAQLGAS